MFKQSKIVMAACACVALVLASTAAAADSEKVSRAMEKPMNAAQEALKGKRYDEALAKLREAQGVAKTAYDQYVINEFLGPVYAQQSRFAEAYVPFEANANSPYLVGRTGRYKLLTQLSYQLKNYANVIDYGNKTMAGGDDGEDVRVLIAQAYYLTGKCKEAASGMQELVSRAERAGKRPNEQSLLLIRQCAQKSNDGATQGRMLEKLLAYYPKADYWALAMNSLMQLADHDDRLTLQVYRLMLDAGAMKRSDQTAEMAQIALERGFPGEAQSVLEQGIAKGVFTEARDKERNGRMLEQAKKMVAMERTTIAKTEQQAATAANGELLVAAGSSYFLNLGDAAKGATLISQGIAKGGLKNVNDAYVTLGLAQWRAKNAAEAERAFGKVGKSEGYERLAKLWNLRVR
jgi:hypothetical protein